MALTACQKDGGTKMRESLLNEADTYAPGWFPCICLHPDFLQSSKHTEFLFGTVR